MKQEEKRHRLFIIFENMGYYNKTISIQFQDFSEPQHYQKNIYINILNEAIPGTVQDPPPIPMQESPEIYICSTKGKVICHK